MSVITEFEKTQADLNFEIDSVEQDGVDIKINCFVWTHYLGNNCSLDDYEYNIGAGWVAMTLSGDQVESDLDNIPINSRKKKVVIVWAGGEDLTADQIYATVSVRLTFNDEPSQAGSESQEETYVIGEVDFTPTEEIIPYRPYPDDQDFPVKFKNLQSYSNVKLHYKIEVDSVNTFDSGDYLSYDTAVSQTNWTFDGGAFPSAGVNPVVDITTAEEIVFSNAALTALAIGDWFIRITRSLN